MAAKLKDPSHGVIADRYDDASILFADIAGYTERAGEIPPTELVRFLDRLYTTFDRLVDRHELEKIKTTGDAYMVVSGCPTHGRTTSRRSPPWPWTCCGQSPTCVTPGQSGPDPYRDRRRSGGRRCGGRTEVLLRRVG